MPQIVLARTQFVGSKFGIFGGFGWVRSSILVDEASDGADIRRYPISDHIRLYLGYPNPTFYSQIPIRTYPNPTFSDFWANFMQIFGYPNELFDFFGYPNPTFLLFRLSDPIRIRHFTIRKYSYPTFLVSAPSLVTK